MKKTNQILLLTVTILLCQFTYGQENSKSDFYNEVLGTFEVHPKGVRAISIGYDLIKEIDQNRTQNEDFVMRLENMDIVIYSKQKISSKNFVKLEELIIKGK